VQFGVHAFVTDTSVDPVTIGREVESRGLDSVWFGEHSHMPVGSVHPATGRGEAPTAYRHFVDPFLALASVAATTTKIRIGTSVALPAEHHPIHFAKSVASLDHLSRGRLDLGVGYGWNTLEMRNLGVDPKRRRARALEHLRAAKELWTREIAQFDGEFASFSPSWSWPKPVQAPHPPIFIGGPPAPWLLEDVAANANGWMPVLPVPLEEIRRSRLRLSKTRRDLGDEAAKKVIGLELIAAIRGVTPAAFSAALPKPVALEAFARAGLDALVVSVPAKTRCDLLRGLDAVVVLRDAVDLASGELRSPSRTPVPTT